MPHQITARPLVRRTIDIEPWLHLRLVEIAMTRGASLAQVFREALAEWVERQPESAAKPGR